MPKKVIVTYRVKRGGAGNGPVWWMLVRKEDVEVVGMGSGRRLAVRKDAKPTWLPRPDGDRHYISRSKGVRVDGSAWVELDEGSFIRVGAVCAGGWRRAEVKSPLLIVEEGAQWSWGDVDGTRSVEVEVINARVATIEDITEVKLNEEVGCDSLDSCPHTS